MASPTRTPPMYVPSHFLGTDSDALSIIRSSPLAAVVTTDAAGDHLASHIPLLYDPATRVFRGHVARSNPLWRAADGRRVLLIFRAESAYVSPRWYLNTKNVPTWNYRAVHARGVLTVSHDEAALRQTLIATSDVLERDTAAAVSQASGCPLHAVWSLSDAPPAYVSALLRDIVQIEVVCDELVCAVKQSQNKGKAEGMSVAAGLRRAGAEAAAAAVELFCGVSRQGGGGGATGWQWSPLFLGAAAAAAVGVAAIAIRRVR